MLENKKNAVDYPDDLKSRKIWSFKYISELYECSMNGARSDKALAHLKKVNSVVHGVACGGTLLILVIVAVLILRN